MKAEATVRLKFPSEKQLETVLNSLRPEAENPSTTRSRAGFDREGAFLVLKVEARDTVALRAALNAYLRWILAVCDVCSTVDSLKLSKEK